MIQRRQSVYLLLAVLIHVLLFFSPFYNATATTRGATVHLSLQHAVVQDAAAGAGRVILQGMTTFMFTFNIVIIALGVVCIFLFNNRKRQLGLSRFLVFMSLVLLGCILYAIAYAHSFALDEGYTHSYGLASWLYVLSPILFFMAGQRILHDERLVRSADRLR